ncbi:hypothetical protein [Streptomyces sp. NPDC045470]|uniref:hypothetical protein n=1 Tax=Streptomyces sp. NPDC045470 TaxID=3155469 RepID=UPI0034057B72
MFDVGDQAELAQVLGGVHHGAAGDAEGPGAGVGGEDEVSVAAGAHAGGEEFGEAQGGDAGLRVVAVVDHVVGGGAEVLGAAQPAGCGGVAFLVVRGEDESEFWSCRAGFRAVVVAGGALGHDEKCAFLAGSADAERRGWPRR